MSSSTALRGSGSSEDRYPYVVAGIEGIGRSALCFPGKGGGASINSRASCSRRTVGFRLMAGARWWFWQCRTDERADIDFLQPILTAYRLKSTRA